MLTKFTRKIAMTASVIATGVWLGTSASAAELEDIFELSAEGHRVAQASQERINALSNETQQLLDEYRSVLKTVEDLRAYNIQKQREINDQEEEIRTLQSSIERATMIDRQILPLMGRMIDVLATFVRNDVPFLMDERQDRIANLRDIMEDSSVSASEKFRLVFEAYQIENDFGRSIETYSDQIAFEGFDEPLEGDILRIGRIGLYFQNEDESVTGHWNPTTGNWEVLDDGYARAISKGLQIAEGQIAPDLIRLPIVKKEQD